MIKWIIIVLLLLAAIWLGWELHQKPSVVLISFYHWQIQTSLLTAIGLLIALFIVIYFLIRLIHWGRRWPGEWRRAHRMQQAERLTELGVCELIEEKWEAAEQHFQKAASDVSRSWLYYLGAALAAQEQAAYQRRDDYLRKAHQTAPNAELTLGILQAKLQIQSQQWPEASATLKKLQSAIPHHPVVKKLLKSLPNY